MQPSRGEPTQEELEQIERGASLKALRAHPSFDALRSLIVTELAQVFEEFVTAEDPTHAFALSNQGRALCRVAEVIDDTIDGSEALGREIAARGEQDAHHQRVREREQRYAKDPIGKPPVYRRGLGI